MFRKLSAWQIYLLTCRWSFYSDVITAQYRKFTQFAALPKHFLVLPRIQVCVTEWMLTKSHCILGNDWQCLICRCKMPDFAILCKLQSWRECFVNCNVVGLHKCFFENIHYVDCYYNKPGCHSQNKNAKYPFKWKTFQAPPLTNDALAIIDRHTLLESTGLNYINSI